MKVEKAGLVVNANKEAVQWVNVGDEFELKDGDTIVSHGKTAEKLGVAEQYKAMKPGKAKKEGSRTHVAVPTSGAYTVSAAKLRADDSSRGTVVRMLMENNDLAEFFATAPETFTTTDRKGETKEHSTKTFVGYAIRRGMITLAP